MALHWEHGYRTHGLWDENNNRHGAVGLGPRNLWDGVYHWWTDRHPDRVGKATTLRAANELLSPTHHRENWSPYAADRWTPSMSMPRWAARLVLPIVSVRPERVCDITEQDARAEGVIRTQAPRAFWDDFDEPPIWSSYRAAFEALWDSIYASTCPFASGWCWVIETKPYQGATR